MNWRARAVALCAALLALPAEAAPLPAAERIADDVYVFAGAGGLPDEANRGRVANVGVIIGRTGIVVIGTGSSAADGEELLAAIGRLSRRPVVLAIDTYAGPEHVLGNGAFARRGIPVLAHRATLAYMASRCASCLAAQRAAAGAAPLAGTQVQLPDRPIDGAQRISAGGRDLELLHYGHTQQAGSIAVFDPASGVLFAGGLASFDTVPDAADADLAGWLRGLEQMRRLPARRVVPGRGPAGPPARLDEVTDYLGQLAGLTRNAYQSGTDLATATDRVDVPCFHGWAGYPEVHRRNVHFEYLRLEARELAQ